MGKKIKAYIIDIREKGINQTTKFVKFIGGIGVLDAKALCGGRPEWFKHKTLKQERGVPIEEYVRYWGDRGAKVTPVDQEEADRIRGLLIKGRPVPDKYYAESPIEEPEEEDPDRDPEGENAEDHLGDGEPEEAPKDDEETAEEHLPGEEKPPVEEPEEEKDGKKSKKGK